MVTDLEYQIFGKFLLEHGLETDGDPGTKNGALLSQVIVSRNQRITPETLQAAFETIKGQLVFVDQTKAEYNRLVANFSDYDRDFIAAKLGSYGYEVSDEQSLLKNWNLVAAEFLRRGYQVTNELFKIVIGNLAAGPNGDQLIRKAQKSKHDSQAAVKAQEESRKSFQRDESQLTVIHQGEHPDSWVRPLSPELRAHREANQRAMAQAEAAKQQTAQPDTTGDYWKGQVEQYLFSIRENNIREYLQQTFSQPKNGSWQFSWRLLDNLYNRIKNQGLATYLAEQAAKA